MVKVLTHLLIRSSSIVLLTLLMAASTLIKRDVLVKYILKKLHKKFKKIHKVSKFGQKEAKFAFF